MEFVLKQYDDILLSFAANRTMDGVELTVAMSNPYLPC